MCEGNNITVNFRCLLFKHRVYIILVYMVLISYFFMIIWHALSIHQDYNPWDQLCIFLIKGININIIGQERLSLSLFSNSLINLSKYIMLWMLRLDIWNRINIIKWVILTLVCYIWRNWLVGLEVYKHTIREWKKGKSVITE